MLAYTIKAKPHRQYIIRVDDKELHQGIQNGTIATTVANTSASSSIGNKDDPSKCTGQPSYKRFILPSGKIVQATEMAEYPFEVRAPANELHITPGVSQDSLFSTSKCADPNYITIYDKETVNIYNANNTMITVTKGAILQGWHDNNIYRIPLVDMVRNKQHQHRGHQLSPNRVPTRETTTSRNNFQLIQVKDPARAHQVSPCISWISD
jgi:hypothetical protein